MDEEKDLNVLCKIFHQKVKWQKTKRGVIKVTKNYERQMWGRKQHKWEKEGKSSQDQKPSAFRQSQSEFKETHTYKDK